MEIDATAENLKMEKTNSLKKKINKLKENKEIQNIAKPEPMITKHKIYDNQQTAIIEPPKPPAIEWLKNGIGILLNALSLPAGSEKKRNRMKRKLAESNDIMSFITMDIGKYALQIPRQAGVMMTYLSILLETKLEPEPQNEINTENNNNAI